VDKGDGDKFYKRVGVAMAEARLAGIVPFDWIEDRGRTVGTSDVEMKVDVDAAVEEAAESISSFPYLLRAGRWHDQSTVVYLWVEKEALSGVLERVCLKWGVGMFACKGYPSLSSLRQWVLYAAEEIREAEAESATILYMGDHDPDGLEIPLSSERRIRQIQELEGEEFDFSIDRIALTMKQIRDRDLPPFGAKMTSARYAKYVETADTTDAWELDALQPPELVALAEKHIQRCFDGTVWTRNWADVHARRDELRGIVMDVDWLLEQMSVD
jgi:hypothetical protein